MPTDLTALRPTERFSSRALNYVKFRPGYPPEIAPFLAERCGLAAGGAVADVGSGTGFLSKVFLEAG
ncbi:MAG TPA: class I SAM-dependent methyltransferase, partial [Thermoanaerobaculia bacterium]